MITTRADFDHETAWERTVLALAVPLTPLSSRSDVILDLRTRGITIGLAAILGESNSETLRDSLLPLVFGAAWKIFDLGVELALAYAGRAPAHPARWTIKEKTREIMNHGSLPGFSASSDSWAALRLLYRNTKEMRHALVHRKVTVEPTTKHLICHDPGGAPLPPITQEEQLAFCRVAQRLAEAVVSGTLPVRAEADLLGHLTILQTHHGIGISSPAGRPPVRVLDDFPATCQIDVPSIMAEAQRTFPGAVYVDLELYLADGRTLLGELEQAAPNGMISIDLMNLPPWLRFI